MLKYDPQAPVRSWISLILCLLLVCSGTAGAGYLGLRFHWVAAAVVVIPTWILLTDLFINKRKSTTWYLLDFARYITTFAGTAAIALFLWGKGWRIVTVLSILPIFVVLQSVIGFLTLGMYDITKEAIAAKDAQESLKNFTQGLGDNAPNEDESKS